MPLDTNIPLSALAPKPIDVMSIYGKAADLKAAQLENQIKAAAFEDSNRTRQDNLTLAELYKSSTGIDGKLDRSGLVSRAANAGLGKMIPGLQKQFMEQDDKQSEIDKRSADTRKVNTETLYTGLKHIDNALSSMLAHPQINDRMVMSEMGRLVSVGAFDAQAQQSGKTPDQFAMDLVSTMPVGNPQALRGWLTQAGMRVMDAAKRVELQLPKYDEQDRGGQINQGTINLMTGQRTAGTDVQKTNTPDALLSSATSQRGQNLQHQAMSAANQIAREAAQSQVVETPQGYAVINKGAADARPVRMDTGQPVLGSGSQSAKNASMARTMTDIIPYARELLKSGPTASVAGAMTDKAVKVMGMPLQSSNVAGQLETLAGWMTSNVPRFEGPQGVQDVLIYQQMAGAVGDRTKSVQERLAAVETVEKLMSKYGGGAGTQPAAAIAPRPAVPQRQFAPVVRGEAGRAAVAAQQAPKLDDFFK